MIVYDSQTYLHRRKHKRAVVAVAVVAVAVAAVVAKVAKVAVVAAAMFRPHHHPSPPEASPQPRQPSLPPPLRPPPRAQPPPASPPPPHACVCVFVSKGVGLIETALGSTATQGLKKTQNAVPYCASLSGARNKDHMKPPGAARRTYQTSPHHANQPRHCHAHKTKRVRVQVCGRRIGPPLLYDLRTLSKSEADKRQESKVVRLKRSRTQVLNYIRPSHTHQN